MAMTTSLKIGAAIITSSILSFVGGTAGVEPTTTTTSRAICSPESKTFTVKVNFEEGHLGYFEFDECDGVHPTIGLKIGETYTFNQGDVSNYYHPMGFAYGPDGALDEQDELEPGITRTNSTCAADFSCPAPRYLLDGNFLGDASNKEDFGLDGYEPLFFYPILDWVERGKFSIAVKFDDANIKQDAFYFCHIHQFMSGRIKFLDASGAPLVADDTPALGYEYDTPGEFDRMCGTVGLDAWQLPHPECTERFVCGLEEARDDKHKMFGLCLEAMNCRMMVGMTTGIGKDPLSLFNYHMIPHHENAVDMAKALLQHTPCDDLTNEEDPYCVMQLLARDIINGQNFQIQIMRNVLEAMGSPPEDDCKVSVVSGDSAVSKGATPNKKSKNDEGETEEPEDSFKKGKKSKKDKDTDEEEEDDDETFKKAKKDKDEDGDSKKSQKCTKSSC